MLKLFQGLSAWAIPLATAASFVFGGIWYGILSKPWMEAAGLRPDQIESPKGPSPTPFVITLIAQLVMAWLFAGLLLHLKQAGLPIDAHNGALAGAFLWLGFIVPPVVVNYQFQMRKTVLSVIDCGHWLGVALIQGAILGAWGLR